MWTILKKFVAFSIVFVLAISVGLRIVILVRDSSDASSDSNSNLGSDLSSISISDILTYFDANRTKRGSGANRINATTKAKRENYDRKKHFGTWQHLGGRLLNARHDLLRKKSISSATTITKRGNKTFVTQGVWVEKFGSEIFYEPKKATVDHLVSLKEAWISGANHWTPQQRMLFYNSDALGQLVIMSRKINAKKSDHDPVYWLPDNPNKTEMFINAWFSIKKYWNLSADEQEMKILRKFIHKKRLKSLKER